MSAIDVSSYQPSDLTALIAEHQPEHVVVRLYQSEEKPSPAHSCAQVASARINRCTVSGYLWLYAGLDPRRQVGEAVVLWRALGLAGVLWLDVEPYTDGTMPGAAELRVAVDEAKRLGVRPGIYSGAWCWPRVGSDEFATLPLWAAQPEGVADVEAVSLFGGWQRAQGKQYRADGLDLDVFAEDVTA